MSKPIFGTPKLLEFDDLDRLDTCDKSVCDTAKRNLREKLLRAWDIHKTNMAYGAETETELEHRECLKWYELLKDLDEWAFENIPYGVKKYL